MHDKCYKLHGRPLHQSYIAASPSETPSPGLLPVHGSHARQIIHDRIVSLLCHLWHAQYPLKHPLFMEINCSERRLNNCDAYSSPLKWCDPHPWSMKVYLSSFCILTYLSFPMQWIIDMEATPNMTADLSCFIPYDPSPISHKVTTTFGDLLTDSRCWPFLPSNCCQPDPCSSCSLY